jgi:CRP/FNR family transcriptional regulator, cyclic AMP receptor protein
MTISSRLAARKGFKSLGGSSPAARRQLISLLKRAKLSPEIPAREIPNLANHVEAFSIAPKTVVFREGDAGTWMAILAQGGVEILKKRGDGQTLVMSVEGTGRLIGEMSLVDGQARSATCVAKERCVLIAITHDHLDDIMRDNPALAAGLMLKIMRLMSRRLRMTSGRLAELM